MTGRELRQLLAQAQQMPEGDARIALLEDLVRHADASGDARLAFDARTELTGAYQHGGETGKGFVTFSWCLAAYDRDPAGFTEQDDALLRWQYKWTVSALQRFPEVPLDRSYRALDDLERRYRTGGHSLHVVYTLRCGIADHIGDLRAGDDWYRKWCAAPRDENSDCVACDPTNKVFHLSLRGRDEEAVAVAEPVLRGRITCTVQPQSIQSVLLLPYLRTGRLDEAREAHRRAYRAIRGNRDYLEDLARHLEFCAVTGNQARGLEILERHLGWLDRPADPMALLEVTGSAALVLRRLRESGHGGQRLRRPGFGDRPTTEPEVAELEAELCAIAGDLAARFDARNGTDFQGRLLAAKLTAEPIVDQLPLSRTRSRHATPSPVVSPPSESASDTLVDPERQDPVLRADALAMRGATLAGAGGDRLEEAVDDLVEAVAIYTEQGMPQAFHTRFDLAVALANSGRLLDAAEAAEEGLSGLEQLSDPDAVHAAAGFRELLVRLYRELGEKEDALKQVEGLIGYLGDGPAPALARAYETAGDILDELNRDASAADRFAAAVTAYRQADDLAGQVRASRRRALSLHWSGHSEAGLAVLADTERLIDALPGDEPEYVAWERAVLAFNHARILAGLGRVDEALTRARAAAQGFRDAGAPDDAEYADALVTQLTGRDPG